MTNPQTIAQAVVTELQANASAITALGTGAVAGNIELFDQAVIRDSFFERLQSLKTPCVLVAAAGGDEGPGEGVWWITSVAVYVRIHDGGNFFTFMQAFVDRQVGGLTWLHRCVIEGQTRQPAGFSWRREVFGVDALECHVIRFRVEDVVP